MAGVAAELSSVSNGWHGHKMNGSVHHEGCSSPRQSAVNLTNGFAHHNGYDAEPEEANGFVDVPAAKRRKLQQKKETEKDTLVDRRTKWISPAVYLHWKETVPEPPNMVRATGQYFFDDKGVKYLDMCNNVAHVGHCHPKVVEAGAKQMAILNTNTRFLNSRIVDYAEELSKVFPESLSCFFFTNSGSEANELALQLAHTVSGRPGTLGLEGAYHGHLKILKELSTFHYAKTGITRNGSCIAPLPDPYRSKYQGQPDQGKLYAMDVKKLIEEQEKAGNKIGVFIHESILSCAGQVIPPDNYLKLVYEYIHEAGGFCIADEVQSGFGRVGKHFWSFQGHGVSPDIVTVGKPMGNGHPVSAVVTTKEIAKLALQKGVKYFNTFGGNPVSMAIADAVLSAIKEEKLQEKAQQLGEQLIAGLKALMDKHPCIGDVRGWGLMIGVEIVKERETRQPDKDLAFTLSQRFLSDYQIIVFPEGVHCNVLKIKPPMCLTLEDCQMFVSGLDAILTSLDH